MYPSVSPLSSIYDLRVLYLPRIQVCHLFQVSTCIFFAKYPSMSSLSSIYLCVFAKYPRASSFPSIYVCHLCQESRASSLPRIYMRRLCQNSTCVVLRLCVVQSINVWRLCWDCASLIWRGWSRAGRSPGWPARWWRTWTVEWDDGISLQ